MLAEIKISRKEKFSNYWFDLLLHITFSGAPNSCTLVISPLYKDIAEEFNAYQKRKYEIANVVPLSYTEEEDQIVMADMFQNFIFTNKEEGLNLENYDFVVRY